ncbi:hypothetical protein ACG33_14890 [Steroidobacter denitrificans]|uniref:Uncharacterized protein n=1 Tax=Steroidobacter denitrificans TaxID=465721 RepID=A0A127FEK8_STEDE|nr:hypothetical protein [Steroidobacter denitrificans]AMN48359.1 hypothetical protein ACG33_14890 [Steroidobacter denitrificans]
MKNARTPRKESSSARPDDVRGEAGSTAGKSSGRAGVDERGNAVWEWRISTGIYSRNPDTLRLRQLEASELSIAETARHQQLRERPGGRSPRSPSGGAAGKAARGAAPSAGGFDPHDQSGSGGGFNPYDRAGSLVGRGGAVPRAGRTALPDASPVRRPPVDLRKFDAWIKLKKRLLGQKD